MSLRRLQPGRKPDLTRRLPLRIQVSATMPTVTTHTTATGIATIATTPLERWRWGLPAVPLIWVRSPLTPSIASRITAPVRSAYLTGTEGARLADGHESSRRSRDRLEAYLNKSELIEKY